MRELKVLTEAEMRNRVGLFVGTRPGIIKFSPLMRELESRGRDFFVIHTGQHYSYEMDQIFFDELELPEPKYRFLNVVNSRFHGGQTARMLSAAERALLRERPKIVLVCGDANTNLAGALAARKLHIAVGHVESGLRSDDWRMPEEHNRVMIDHISEYLFAPTEEARRNLELDNVKGKVFVTGNTIVDAVRQNLGIAERKSSTMTDLGLEPNKYFLLTLHREESVDYRENLVDILNGVREVAEKHGRDIVFPAHPRTVRRIRHFGLDLEVNDMRRLRVVEPLGYLDFLMLLGKSRLVLTDSGGIQEEACILGVPCVTLRRSTERPETVDVGANRVSGTDPAAILASTDSMLEVERRWPNPFGEQPSKEIIDVVETCLSSR